jgi:hypothetical protein
MRDNVARVRELLSQAKRKPTKPEPAAELQLRRAFELYEFNSAPAVLLEQTPRARAERETVRIATWYGWMAEIARALDMEGATSIESLSDDGLGLLLDRLQRLEHCMQEGLDPPDCAPAR